MADGEKDPIVIMFVPPLVHLLMRAEQLNGGKISRKQVEAIRDNAQAITVARSVADAVAAELGYVEIDPNLAWSHWVEVRDDLMGYTYDEDE
jgi:hypothetical protein